MTHLSRLTFVLVTTLIDRARSAARDDRGDSPVSTAVIVTLLALAAVGVAAAIKLAADGWTSKIPKAP